MEMRGFSHYTKDTIRIIFNSKAKRSKSI
jgi:hypothetical protein